MKKFLLTLVTFLLISVLASCGTQESTQAPSGDTQAESTETKPPVSGKGFRVGYSRNDVTPQKPVPLGGYGNNIKRMSTGFLDYLYTTCVAMIDENDQILLMFTTDVIGPGAHSQRIKDRLQETMGIPASNVIVTATHTHSSIDQTLISVPAVVEWVDNLINVMEKTAQEAIADASEATMHWTTCDLTGYNYVRHYFSSNGMSVGDNHNGNEAWGWSELSGHTTEANHEMYMVKFAREGKKDVLLCNWRAHATITGGSSITNISSDYIGQMRTEIEKEEDVLFAYFQGEAGNINPKTRLSSDTEYNPPAKIKEYGKEVSAIMLQAIRGEWVDLATGPIYTANEIIAVEGNHTRLDKKADAEKITAAFKENGWDTELNNMLMAAELYSPYEASAILSRSDHGTVNKSIHATVIGDFCFTNLQAEQFDTNGTWIRENAPSKYTMIISYTDDTGYVPSAFAYEYGCYESDTTICGPGSGELLAEKELELLKKMWKESGR